MINGNQVRSARAWLGMSQEALAEKADVSKRTVMRFEMGHENEALPRTIQAIQATLEGQGMKFIFEKKVGVGVRVRLLPAEGTQSSPPKKRTGAAKTKKR